MFCSSRDVWPASQLRYGVQRSLDVSGQVREPGWEVAHQQDDRREAGGAERGQEEKATLPSSLRPQLYLLSGLELWDLPRAQLQGKTSLLSRDLAWIVLSGQTSGSQTQSQSASVSAQNIQLQEIEKCHPVLLYKLEIFLFCFNTITSVYLIPDIYFDRLNNILGFYLYILVVV